MEYLSSLSILIIRNILMVLLQIFKFSTAFYLKMSFFTVCSDNLQQISLENCTGALHAYDNGTCYDMLDGKLIGIHNKTVATEYGIIPVLPAEDFMK